MTHADVLADHVARRAQEWYPELVRPTVALVEERSTRVRSHLYRFRLADGERIHDVLAKTTSLTAEHAYAEARTSPRPRLGALSDYEVKHRLEYAALCAVAEHFASCADPRLAAVRPLGHLPELRTLFMEYVDEPTLRQRCAVLRRGHRQEREALIPLFEATGAWLRSYHGLPTPTGAEPRRAHRDEVVAALLTYGRYLAEHADPSSGHTARRTADAARACLPEQLPLGLVHGDFAPRNVFASSAGKVAAFDMLARRRVPVYEDIAYFTLALRLGGAQAATQGLAYDRRWLDRLEQAFLAGYFGASAACPVLQVFEQLVLLDRWAAHVTRARQPGLRWAPARRLYTAAVQRAYRREAERLAAAAGR